MTEKLVITQEQMDYLLQVAEDDKRREWIRLNCEVDQPILDGFPV